MGHRSTTGGADRGERPGARGRRLPRRVGRGRAGARRPAAARGRGADRRAARRDGARRPRRAGRRHRHPDRAAGQHAAAGRRARPARAARAGQLGVHHPDAAGLPRHRPRRGGCRRTAASAGRGSAPRPSRLRAKILEVDAWLRTRPTRRRRRGAPRGVVRDDDRRRRCPASAPRRASRPGWTPSPRPASPGPRCSRARGYAPDDVLDACAVGVVGAPSRDRDGARGCRTRPRCSRTASAPRSSSDAVPAGRDGWPRALRSDRVRLPMTARVSHTTVDCRDAYALSEWWKGVLDYVDVEDDPNLPGHEECMISAATARHRLLFIEVPEAKSGKNRIHLDLEPVEGTPRRRAGPPPRARRRRGGRPARAVRARHRVGRPRRPRGQRVLHPAQPRRARGRPGLGRLHARLLTGCPYRHRPTGHSRYTGPVPTSTNRSLQAHRTRTDIDLLVDPGTPWGAASPDPAASGQRGPPHTEAPPHPRRPHALDPRPDRRPSGRRALVTGANSGIGLVEALELARHGADVVLAVRNTDAGEAAAERIRAAGVRRHRRGSSSSTSRRRSRCTPWPTGSRGRSTCSSTTPGS